MDSRTFKIQWDPDGGPLWMNRDNLLLCLCNTCHNTKFTVRDVTRDGMADERPRSEGPVNPHFDRRLKEKIITAVAGAWCHLKNEHKVMDPVLAMTIVDNMCEALGIGPVDNDSLFR